MTTTPQVLLSTEGTYPFMVGGVSTWCDSLINGLPGIDWHVLSITAGGLRRRPLFEFPTNVVSVAQRELWSDSVAKSDLWRLLGPKARRSNASLVASLANGIFGWDANTDELLASLVWCREHSGAIQTSFRSSASWANFVDVMRELGSADGISFTLADAAEIYQTLYWVARLAAEPTRDQPGRAIDLHLVTAAGWAGIGAVVDRALDPKPVVLAEHGVYVREAYLQSARNVHRSQTQRWCSARLARGLSRLVYANTDVVAPVTQANARWERHLGVEERAIRPIYNGVLVPPHVAPFPEKQRVITIGRLDPLKDIKTMLRAASTVLASRSDVEFVHFGPVPDGNDTYASSCLQLHADLELGNGFSFRGPTTDPFGELSKSSLAVFSSISEGFPITVLEAMACGRPVVATAVGGVPEALAGCGLTVRPGDYEGLAAGILRLVNDPSLLRQLGERSYVKVRHEFGMAQCLQNYRDLIAELTGIEVEQPIEPTFPGIAETPDLAPLTGDHAADLAGSDMWPLPSGR